MSSAGMVPAEWPDARIVVVDDEEPINRLVGRLLDVNGYTRVASFGDPVDAVAALEHDPAELVILDLHMPRLSGTEVLRKLMLAPEDERAAVIVMTGAGTGDDARTTLALGAADFLRKPVDSSELLLRVRHQLRERRLRRDLAAHNDRLEELVAERAGAASVLSRVLDAIPVAATVLTPDFAIHYANAQADAMLGAGENNVLVADDVLRESLRRHVNAIDADGAGGSPLTARIRSGGAERRVEIHARRVEAGLTALIVLDVERQELAKDALRRALDHEQRANQESRKVEALRTSFLSAVSHELRTPLTVVVGMAELLHHRLGAIDAAQQADMLERLLRNAERLGALLEDLLDLNRLSAGQLTVSREQRDLAEIVAAAVSEVEHPDHDVRLDVAPCEVWVEAAQIRRAVANLVRNAVIHTPPGTRIDVGLDHDDDRVRIVVADDGDGVPDDLKRRIFDPFEQGPSAPAHKPGTGIGLSLVAEFSRLHDGRAWVEDTPGGGATFMIEVPRAAPAEAHK